jgi:hypothetical protein
MLHILISINSNIKYFMFLYLNITHKCVIKYIINMYITFLTFPITFTNVGMYTIIIYF